MSAKKRINVFVVVLLISLGASAMLMLVPSQKQKRAMKLHKEEQELNFELAIKTSLANTDDVARVKGASQFVIPSKSLRKAELYLFVPTLNNNIAVISGPAKNPFLGNDFRDFEVHVIPVSQKESPGSNLAIKLAVLFPGPIGQGYIDVVGQHPTTSMETLEKAWAAVPQVDKDKAEAQIAENLRRSSEAGPNQALFIYGPFQFKAKAWFEFRDPISKIMDLYRRH